MRALLLTLVLLLTAPHALAQDLSAGKYSGRYSNAQGNVNIVLDIKGVDDGKITGTGSRQAYGQAGKSTACSGDFPLTGSLKGNQLEVRAAAKFGRAGDCNFRLHGTVVDNKIQGKVGQNDVELTR